MATKQKTTSPTGDSKPAVKKTAAKKAAPKPAPDVTLDVTPEAKPDVKTSPKVVAPKAAAPKATSKPSAVPTVPLFPDLTAFKVPALPEVPEMEELMAFSKDNMAAAVKAAALDDSAAITKAMMDCQSLPDLMDLQSDMAKTVYDKAISDGKKMSEVSVKISEDAVEPLTERFALVVERLGLKDAA